MYSKRIILRRWRVQRFVDGKVRGFFTFLLGNLAAFAFLSTFMFFDFKISDPTQLSTPMKVSDCNTGKLFLRPLYFETRQTNFDKVQFGGIQKLESELLARDTNSLQQGTKWTNGIEIDMFCLPTKNQLYFLMVKHKAGMCSMFGPKDKATIFFTDQPIDRNGLQRITGGENFYKKEMSDCNARAGCSWHPVSKARTKLYNYYKIKNTDIKRGLNFKKRPFVTFIPDINAINPLVVTVNVSSCYG